MKSFVARLGGVLLILFTLILIIAEQDAYSDVSLQGDAGDIYVDIRKLTSRDAKKIGKALNHPYELSDDVLAKALSSIYYREKGLFKFKKKSRQAVFSSDEVRTITPLIGNALSRADADEYVIVNSEFDRVLLSDTHTYCMFFVAENELNIVFTAIRQKLSYNITESDKARMEKIFAKPLDIKKSSLWELVPVQGQRLKGGHLNWLLIDLMTIMISEPVAKGEDKWQETPEAAYASELEERVKRLEERARPEPSTGFRSLPEEIDEDTYIRADVAKEYMPKGPSNFTEEEWEIRKSRNLDIREKFERLRALRDEGLITERDYRSKKAQIIRQEQKNKSIREKLKELRDMREEGLISEKDYESLKKEVLDKWF